MRPGRSPGTPGRTGTSLLVVRKVGQRFFQASRSFALDILKVPSDADGAWVVLTPRTTFPFGCRDHVSCFYRRSQVSALGELAQSECRLARRSLYVARSHARSTWTWLRAIAESVQLWDAGPCALALIFFVASCSADTFVSCSSSNALATTCESWGKRLAADNRQLGDPGLGSILASGLPVALR